MPVPILLISDSPTSGTGLGRITCDLATRIHKHLPEFRVGTMGYGGPISRKLGFPQYPMDMKDWVLFNLPEVWEDFAGEERGILMTIWDASRLLWFSRPENCTDPRLRKFLTDGNFERWGYFPMDATGPDDRLTAILGHIMNGYDRVLGYSKWAYDILKNTLEPKELDLDWRPHGLDTSVFYPRHHRAARNGFGERIRARTSKGKWMVIPSDTLFIGIVATNQMRKDYGLGIQIAAQLAEERKVILWIHTDVLERHWSIPALIKDFNFHHDNCVVTMVQFTDDQMAWNYSACDVTLGIGLGEGFGYPIFESLACGTPCIHGNYGGAPEHMKEEMVVEPYFSRLEGCYNCIRPVYDPNEWVRQIKMLPKRSGESLLPSHLDWENLWPSWAEWFLKGLEKWPSTLSLTTQSSM
jgi:glycosyltransferase involved in cell wall biosynthesis